MIQFTRMGSDDISARTRERARVRKAVRKHIHEHGQPRDRKRRSDDNYSRAPWLAAQKAALELQAKMDSLISRPFAEARVRQIHEDALAAFVPLARKLAPGIASESDAGRIRAMIEAEFPAGALGVRRPLRELVASFPAR